MSSSSSSVSLCPSTRFVAQLESSTLLPPSFPVRPCPSNCRRRTAAGPQHPPRLSVPSGAQDAISASPAVQHHSPDTRRSLPTVRSSSALLPSVGTRRASLAEDEVRWGLLRSTLASAPPPAPLSIPSPDETRSQMWVLPEYIPPAPNTVTVEVTVSDADGTPRSRLRSAASIPTLRNLVGDPLPSALFGARDQIASELSARASVCASRPSSPRPSSPDSSPLLLCRPVSPDHP
ncbi:hypothetical protein SCHPADRAFT_941192 [Schizopora paradoxa]|uniref:Uncharacterized protein n=1 Tax=Schizopora paradoxa TaxID=27342 RepID=A0A0H2S6J8_9AGAM|nr:hypothetical protein SCHPADRAFT_941192 [Schizopora paradoxa]